MILAVATNNRTRYGVGRVRQSIETFLKPSTLAKANLDEELALMRVLVNDVVTAYEIASEAASKATAGDYLKLQLALAPLQDQIADLVAHVRVLAKAMVEIDSHYALRPELVADLAKAIDTALDKMPEGEAKAELEHVLSTQLARALSQSTAETTVVLSPAETVAQIDKAIPYLPEAKELETAEPKASNGQPLDKNQLPNWTTLDDLERQRPPQ